MDTRSRKYFRAHDLMARYGCSISTINRWERAGLIPKAIQFNRGGPRFWESFEIEQSDKARLENRAA